MFAEPLSSTKIFLTHNIYTQEVSWFIFFKTLIIIHFPFELHLFTLI